MSSFDNMLSNAQQEETSAKSMLHGSLMRIGIANDQYQSGTNQHANLSHNLSEYIKKVARLETLLILKNEDFYVAMTRSAGEVTE